MGHIRSAGRQRTGALGFQLSSWPGGVDPWPTGPAICSGNHRHAYYPQGTPGTVHYPQRTPGTVHEICDETRLRLLRDLGNQAQAVAAR
jgi:hypothetical protein